MRHLTTLIKYLPYIIFITIIFSGCSSTQVEEEDTLPDIIFLSDRTGRMELHTLQIETGEVEILDMPDFPSEASVESYAWSPKVNKWFFSLSTAEGNDIYSLELGTGNWERITEMPSVIKSPIVPSPSGEYLAFIGFMNGTDVFIIDTNGTDLVHKEFAQSSEIFPVWTEDSDHLIFRSDLNGLPNIFMIDKYGENLQNVSNGPGVDGLFDVSNISDKIVFESDRDGNRDLFVAELGEQDYLNVTSHPARDVSPIWSPDETYILFQSDRDGGEDLYILNIDQNVVTRLTSSPDVGELNPVWCPDSQCVLFNANQNDNQDIFQVNLDGEIINLTNSEANEISPEWWTQQ
jgi:Tol biopolymer transport system component